jgi:hypothetical protein
MSFAQTTIIAFEVKREVQMSIGARITTVIALFAAAAALATYAVVTFFLPVPATVDFTSAHRAGAPVNLTVQVVPSIGFGAHPTWVSYFVKSPQGKWIHSTVWKVPAHTRVNITIQQYDSGSPLRNQFWGQVQGTINSSASLNGTNFKVYNANAGNGVGHTFSIPTMGVSVPLVGISGSSTNTCSVGPCGQHFDHNVIKFSFVTGHSGEYPWQCFVPCGLGYLFGNGGPMSTEGYMGGFLDVTA